MSAILYIQYFEYNLYIYNYIEIYSANITMYIVIYIVNTAHIYIYI